jgi:uncharacterized SAM-binding protein YcdF (DUF218 family)
MRRKLWLLAGALLFAFGAFLHFIDGIARLTPDLDDHADAIAVLTGGSVRVAAGLELLAQGRAPKLFISGVHPGTGKAALAAVTGHAALYECCVELGFEAADTVGNAMEIAHWARAQAVRSLIVVTANYHWPRARVELARFLPSLRLQVFPVVPERVKLDAWWMAPGTAGLLLGEFGKYVAALLRFRLGQLLQGGG